MNDLITQITEKYGKYFNASEVKGRTINEWRAIFSSELSNTFSTKTYYTDFNWIYRSRIIDDERSLWTHTKELWAPPRKKVVKQGRCNAKNQSLLYLSTNVTTTLFELRPAESSRLIVMEYKSLGEIGELKIIGQRDIIRINEGFKSSYKNHFENSTQESILLDYFLSFVFKSKSQFDLGYNSYNLTNAITQIFLHNQKGVDSFHPVSPKSVGLVYPSVETVNQLGVNIVVDPKFVKKLLRPNKCFCYSVQKRVDRNHYQIRLTHETSKIYPNGEMKWCPVFGSNIEYITDL